ncbi:hypothetical protein [Oscillatoria nigro-viridis]|nr:hypothetical protein [Oscillatoria nigro-viridis]
MKAINCHNFQIWTIAFIEWNNSIKEDIVELKPLNAARIISGPGPKSFPARPYIKTYASPGGLASTVYKGDDETMPIALWVGDTARLISLSETPLDLSARSDGGVWISTHQTLLFHYDRAGALKHRVNLPGTNIVGVDGDAVWVMTDEKAWFVNVNGDVRGSYPWKGFNRSAGSKQAICQLERDKIRRIQCLEPDGSKHFVNISLPKSPSGKLLFFSDDKLLTGSIGSGDLGYYSTGGIAADLTIENAGMTGSGDAFISMRTDDDLAEVCLTKGTGQRFALKYKIPSFPLPVILSVLAVEGDRTLVYGADRAVWYKGSQIEKSFTVDDNVYRKEIFPHHWRTATNFVTANSSDGTIIISTSGPTGMALIGMRWHPEPQR